MLLKQNLPDIPTSTLETALKTDPLTIAMVVLLAIALIFMMLAFVVIMRQRGESGKDQAETGVLTMLTKMVEASEKRLEKREEDYQKSLLTISENNARGFAQVAEHLATQTDLMGVWVEDGKSTSTNLRTIREEVTKVPGTVRGDTATIAQKYHAETQVAINKHFDTGLKTIRDEIKALTEEIHKSNELVSKNFADDGTVLLMFNRLAQQVEQLTSHLDKALDGQKGTTHETQITFNAPAPAVTPPADLPGSGAVGDSGSHPGSIASGISDEHPGGSPTNGRAGSNGYAGSHTLAPGGDSGAASPDA